MLLVIRNDLCFFLFTRPSLHLSIYLYAFIWLYSSSVFGFLSTNNIMTEIVERYTNNIQCILFYRWKFLHLFNCVYVWVTVCVSLWSSSSIWPWWWWWSFFLYFFFSWWSWCSNIPMSYKKYIYFFSIFLLFAHLHWLLFLSSFWVYYSRWTEQLLLYSFCIRQIFIVMTIKNIYI